MLGLSITKFEINKYAKFFENNGKYYFYFNRIPWRISFAEVSKNFLDLIKQFDGSTSVSEIISKNNLNNDFIGLVNILQKYSVLVESGFEYPKIVKDNISLIFFPTNTCNLRCIYCYASAGETPSINLDINKAKTWIEYVFSNLNDDVKSISVVFHGGGEPTNAPKLIMDIYELVKTKSAEKNLDVSVGTITNGNFEENVLEWLIREKARVTFSLDGVKEENDYFRPRADGKGSFEKAYFNIKKLKSAGLRVAIRCTLGRRNKDKINKLIDLASELGIKSINIDKLNPFGRADDIDDYTISDEEYNSLVLEAWKYGLSKSVMLTGYFALAVNIGRYFYCNDYDTTSLSLTPEGFLSPCPEVSLLSDEISDTFFLGKLNDDGKIDFDFNKINNLKNRVTENIPDCKDCYMEFVCNGGCVVKSYRHKNDLLHINKDKCDSLRELSLKLLIAILDNPEIFPNSAKMESFQATFNNPEDSYINYITFLPFRR